MPKYDVTCPKHGVREIERAMDQADFCPVRRCPSEVTRVFSAAGLPGLRVEDSENIGAERSDYTRNFNLGLPGENVSLGKDSTGKERLAYKPRRSSETPLWKTREIAKANNLTPIDSGRYRTVGQR